MSLPITNIIITMKLNPSITFYIIYFKYLFNQLMDLNKTNLIPSNIIIPKSKIMPPMK